MVAGKEQIKGLTVSITKEGRYWLWSDALQINLAYGQATKEDMLLAAINSLLYNIELRDFKLSEFKRLQTLVAGFIDGIAVDEELVDHLGLNLGNCSCEQF